MSSKPHVSLMAGAPAAAALSHLAVLISANPDLPLPGSIDFHPNGHVVLNFHDTFGATRAGVEKWAQLLGITDQRKKRNDGRLSYGSWLDRPVKNGYEIHAYGVLARKAAE